MSLASCNILSVRGAHPATRTSSLGLLWAFWTTPVGTSRDSRRHWLLSMAAVILVTIARTTAAMTGSELMHLLRACSEMLRSWVTIAAHIYCRESATGRQFVR